MTVQHEVRAHLPGELPAGWDARLADTLAENPNCWVRVPGDGQIPPTNTGTVLLDTIVEKNVLHGHLSIDTYWYRRDLYFRLSVVEAS
ncbi:hypothetical protein FK268_12845 [Tsukamurella sputi]|uniref:Uncharacterized protein n=1 Tax=Tsukamurella sputi TaxID=2591848 RepID=A0A5C5RLX7_9ACTN|nr:hypothetical protein [Tsukamurella sputi]TWS23201.1 hypothetical protein FK268_12845 [Tsukamurella sputi]